MPIVPIPDLDDKRYADLVREAVASLAVRAPAWTDHNASDPGITLVELFAWLAEMQIYGLNCLTPDHYRTFLRLVGIRPVPAVPATVALSLSSTAGRELLIPRGTRLTAEAGGEPLPFETTDDLFLLNNRIVAVISAWGGGFRNVTDANARDALFFPAFGEQPAPGGTLLIAFERMLPAGREVRLAIDLYEADLPPVGAHRDEPAAVVPPVDLVWEYSTDTGYRRLDLLEDGTTGLTRSGQILFSVPADMTATTSPYLPATVPAPRYPMIRCRLPEEITAVPLPSGGLSACRRAAARQGAGFYEIPPRIDSIRLNTVTARQAVSVVDEILVSSSGADWGNGMPGQVVPLARRPAMEGSLRVRVLTGTDWEEWAERDNLDASGPMDRHFVLDPAGGTILFGDGRNGRVLPEGARVRADYLSGGGAAGNLRPLASWRFDDPLLADLAARNDASASGGRDAEPLEEAIARAPLELREVDRAITSDDFEYLALNTPGLRVARARALPLWEPEAPEDRPVPATVTVVVVPWSFTPRPYPGPRFLRAVCDHLDRHRLVTTRVRVIPPLYAQVTVRTRVSAGEGVRPEELRARVAERLLAFLHPLKGGEDGTGWPFGRGVYRSEIIAAIREVSGVECVLETTLSGDTCTRADGEGNLMIDRDALVYSERHEVDVTARSGRCTVTY